MSLRPPNKERATGNIVYYTPTKFTKFRLLHGAYIPELDLTIQFELMDMISYYPNSIMTEENMEGYCYIIMTSE